MRAEHSRFSGGGARKRRLLAATMRPMARSAGLLMYRRPAGRWQVLLVHPGGPFFARRDAGAWSVPKGLVEPGEDDLAAARREFAEETGQSAGDGPFLELGEVRQAGGKAVVAFAFAGDLDPATMQSNEFELEWPRGSGRMARYPEVDQFRVLRHGRGSAQDQRCSSRVSGSTARACPLSCASKPLDRCFGCSAALRRRAGWCAKGLCQVAQMCIDRVATRGVAAITAGACPEPVNARMDSRFRGQPAWVEL